MHAIEFMARVLPLTAEYPEKPQPGVCCVTGRETSTIHRRHLLSQSFTDAEYLLAPDSERIGCDVWRVWMYGERRPGKKRDYRPERMSSWICTDDAFQALDKDGVRQVLFSPPEGAWVGYVTTSYKKHGSLRAPVNAGGPGIWLFETQLVDCRDIRRMQDIWRRLSDMRQAGAIYADLLTLQPSLRTLRAVGVQEWLSFERWARPHYRSSLYAFLHHLLPPVEKKTRQEKETAGAQGHLL